MSNRQNSNNGGCGCGTYVFIALVILAVTYYAGWQHLTPDLSHLKLPNEVKSLLKTDVGQSIAHAATSGKSNTQVATNGLSGAPTLSASQMQTILKKAGSPVKPTFGQTLYDLGEQYHIDSAYALYWFDEESSYGTHGAAVSRHNFGNLICTPDYPSCDGSFRSYGSWEAGAEDWFKLMDSSTYAGKSIEAITAKYAPANDGNNPDDYAALARSTVARWRTGDVNP